ncbi:IS66 family insertion sequence element accessory protein TnpA [Aliivibrio salmonicida]|uniref:IS66 family insertion sequence element accessory protein TnpA n=1 Tax=Aliivibrio salmonicida TaxID=40269 RepID=UPI00031B4B13|nr:hypothetical protein [Aliivibrio salmonicida]
MQKDKKRTPEQWHALFESQQSSKLSAAEFCRNHNILPRHLVHVKHDGNKRLTLLLS